MKPTNQKRTVLYIGEDERYKSRLFFRFKEMYPAIDWSFPNIEVKKIREELGAQGLFSEIISHAPKIIYFDVFSKDQDVFFLIELISRDPSFKNVPICGLIDKQSQSRPYFEVGASLIFIKGIDLSDAINIPMTIAFAELVKPLAYAKAKIAKPAKIIDDVRVCFLTSINVHIESNIPMEPGVDLTLVSEIPKKFVRSEKYTIINRDDSDLYYDYPYGYDLKYHFVDAPLLDSQMKPEHQKLLVDQHREEVEWSHKKHGEWIVHNVEDRAEKELKVLVIDKSMRVLNQKETGDIRKIPFGLRFQTCLSESLDEIAKIRPVLIGYQMFGCYSEEEQKLLVKAARMYLKPEDEWDVDGIAKTQEEKSYREILLSLSEKSKEDLESIAALVDKVKSILGFKPIIILYGNYFEEDKSLQDTYQYPLITTKNEVINVRSLINIAKKIQEKKKTKYTKIIQAKVAALKIQDPKKHAQLTVSNFEDKRYYIKSYNQLSHGSIELEVTIHAMSESELYFATKHALSFTTYRMNYPVEMAIQIVPMGNDDIPKDTDEYVYRALIHCVSEKDKQKLREEVNKVFFKPLKEKRELELEAFRKLNEDAKKAKEKKTE